MIVFVSDYVCPYPSLRLSISPSVHLSIFFFFRFSVLHFKDKGGVFFLLRLIPLPFDTCRSPLWSGFPECRSLYEVSIKSVGFILLVFFLRQILHSYWLFVLFLGFFFSIFQIISCRCRLCYVWWTNSQVTEYSKLYAEQCMSVIPKILLIHVQCIHTA